MQIHLNPRNISLTGALRGFVSEKLDRLDELAGDILTAHVVFQHADTAAADRRFCVKVHLAVGGKDVFASDLDSDLYAAIDKVSSKLARRLRKRKTRLLDQRESRSRAAARSRDDQAMTDAFMKTKILLVDDDSSILAALTGVLKSEGYDVRHAVNGHDALVAFHTLPDIGLVLLDLNMPVKGGWDTFERLTAINPLLPIIIITARPDQQSLAVEAGAAALMEKPLEIPVLLETMQKLLAEPPETRLARIAGQNPRTLFPKTPGPMRNGEG